MRDSVVSSDQSAKGRQMWGAKVMVPCELVER